MVNFDLWEKLVPKEHQRGYAHITCLEKILGNQLRPNDFTDCPANDFVKVWLAVERSLEKELSWSELNALQGFELEVLREELSARERFLKGNLGAVA